MVKRHLSLILVCVIFFIGIPAATAEDYSYIPTEATFSSEYPKSGEFGAGIMVSGTKNMTVKAYLAVYRAGGSKYALGTTEKSIALGKIEKINVSVQLQDVEEGDIAKLFLWDSNLCPLAAVRSSEAPRFEKPSYSSVLDVLTRVNNYWIGMHKYPGDCTWDEAVYHVGNIEAYMMTSKKPYYDYSVNWAEKNEWSQPSTDIYFADHQTCFQTYIDIYNIENLGDTTKIAKALQVMESQINTSRNSYMYWIDALFMAMPVFSKIYILTNDSKYLDKQYEYYRYAYDNFYDKEEHLWYRDASYIDDRYNDKKIFWSRGNGWVVGALVKMMQDLPDGDPHMAEYRQTFKEMIDKLVSVQREDGAWNRSLIIPEQALGPETSGTAFFLYGIAWGINNGILDKPTYLPPLLKGWEWLSETAVRSDGHLGYVQPMAANPGSRSPISEDSTYNFGVGAFLLLSCEMLRLSGEQVTVQNMIPLINERMVSSMAFKENSSNAANQGAEIKLMEGPCAKIDGEYAIPASAIENDGVNKVQYGGMDYVFLKDIADSLNKKIYVYNNGVILLAHNRLFNPKYEQNFIDLIGKAIDDGAFPSMADDETPIPDVTDLPELPEDAVYISPDAIEINLEPEPQNHRANMVDRNLMTRWSARIVDNGDGSYTYPTAVFDLGSEQTVSKANIAFYAASRRITYFTLEYSNDGVNWIKILDDAAESDSTPAFEEFYFPEPVTARYIRFVGTGGSTSLTSWISIAEIEIYKADENVSYKEVTVLNPVGETNIEVHLGTEITDIELPIKVTAVYDGGTATLEKGTHFDWICDNYNANTPGEYIFTTDFSHYASNIAKLGLKPITVNAIVTVTVVDSILSLKPSLNGSNAATDGVPLDDRYAGNVTTEFDIEILKTTNNALVGYTQSDKKAAYYLDLSAVLRFGTEFGRFDAYNGNTYTNSAFVSYPASDEGAVFHVRFEFNTVDQTYNVWITPEGGVESKITDDYKFGNPILDIGQVCPWAGDYTDAGTFVIKNHTVSWDNPAPAQLSEITGIQLPGISYSEQNQRYEYTVEAELGEALENALPWTVTALYDGGSVQLVSGTHFNWVEAEGTQPDINTPGKYEFYLDFTGFESALEGINLKLPETLPRLCALLNYSKTYYSINPLRAFSVTMLDKKYGGGDVTAEFDLTILFTTVDGVVGFATGNEAKADYSHMSTIVRFGTKFGYFDAYNGTKGYNHSTDLVYPTADTGKQYHMKFVINVTEQKYDVYVTPLGGTETKITDGYSFRKSTSDIGQICVWAGSQQNAGTFMIRNLKITGDTIE